MQLSNANLSDRLYLAYFVGLTVAIVLLRHRVPGWAEYVALHAIVMALIVVLVVLSPRWPHAHAWYPYALPLLVFHEAALLRTLFMDDWQDRYILDFETRVFTTPPTVWLGQLRSPVLSELLQAGYLSYFLFIPIVAGVLYSRDDKRPFYAVMAATVLGYLTCYMIFLVFPTEGPAHTLRHLHTQALPDGPLHSLVAFTQRAGTHGNAFPSAHVVGAVVPVIFAWRYVPKLVPWLLPLLVLMGVGAVYDRYHYASDIIAGVAIGIACAVFVMKVQPNQGGGIMRTHKASSFVALAILFAGGAVAAHAQEVRVMSSGGLAAPYLDLIPAIERATAQKVVTVVTSTGIGEESIPNRLRRGEAADVVMLPDAALTELVAAGLVVSNSRVPLARSGIGMAVRAGAAKPDISSVDGLRRALLQARSIAYSAQVSGLYLSNELFARLGIADQLKSKSIRVERERVGAVVARGEAEIGFQQVSELLPIGGVDYVGPLPAEVQRMTLFSAGVASHAKNPEGARALIAFLQTPAAEQMLKRYHLEPVAAAAAAHQPEIATAIAFTEGPTVDREGNVYFTELVWQRILKLSPTGILSTFREQSNNANGLLIDREGRLIACEGADAPRRGTVARFRPQVTRTDLRTGAIEILADSFEGKPLVGPNDVTIDGRGRLYVTDLTGAAVYRIDGPQQVSRILAAPHIQRPNGIQIAPDDRTLYLIEANGAPGGARLIRAYDLAADGTVSNMRVHYNFSPGRSGDGMSIDTEGNLYVSAGMNQLRGTSETLDTTTGVYVISPHSKLLKFIPIMEDYITNNAFGGPDMKTLYVTAGKTVYRVRTDIAGLPR